jgi:response regulator NasT
MLAMEQEITALTSKLEDRKVIEKAKGLLMKMHNVDEQSAYRALQKSAMQSSLSLAQVAKNLLVTMETLS